MEDFQPKLILKFIFLYRENNLVGSKIFLFFISTKMPRGRPRKYNTDEERREAKREADRKYYREKGKQKRIERIH